MKAYARRNYTKREIEALSQECDKRIQDSLSKVQWLMFVAFNDTLGIGEERLLRVVERYAQLVEEYNGLKRDDVADELLARRIKQILPNSFEKLYD